MKVNIETSWQKILEDEFKKEYFLNLLDFIISEYKSQIIYPPENLIFNGFNQCSFNDVNVVIIGQDPYHGDGQADGLSFSVPNKIKIPPSLQNIFKELYSDLSIEIPIKGNLTKWAQQGVLLLNSILTVRRSVPGSHKMMGWEIFTDRVINLISQNKKNIVFILWGAYAQKKGTHIDRNKHLVIESSHPSPFSVNKGFFGSKPFSKTNDYLRFHKKKEINW